MLRGLLDLPLHRTPQLDSLEYLIRAERFLRGDFATPAVPAHGPGYPVFIALIYRLSGRSLVALGVVQSVIGAGLCMIVAALGRRWFGRAAGLLAGGLLAVYGPIALVGTSLLAEGLLLFLAALSLWILESGEISLWRAALSGASIGLATLVRPTAIVLLPLLAILSIRRGASTAKGWAAAGVLSAAVLAALSPVLAANWRATRSLVLVQGHGGLNLYIGNSPSGKGIASGRYGGSWDSMAGEALRHGVTRPSEQDRYYVDKAVQEIRRAPLAYLRLLARKLLLTFQAEEVRDSHSYGFFVERIPVLRFLPGFGVLLAFGVCGIVVAVRSRRVPFAPVGYLFFFTATCVLLVVGTRYRMPIVPVMATFAGLGAARLIEVLRFRRSRETLALAAVVVVAWLFSHSLRDPASHRFAEEWYFTGSSLAREEDWRGAEDAYRRAVGIDPRFAPAWTGLGTVSSRRGDWAEAKEEFARAVALDPAHARAHTGLGLALEEAGNRVEATRELRRARELRPDDLDTLRALARVLSAGLEWEAAGETYRALIRLAPGEPGAHLGLARVETALRRLDEAHGEAAIATQLAPGDAEGWLLRAVLAIDLAKPEEATRALERVEALAGRGRPPVEYAWALLERLEGKREAAEFRLKRLLAGHPDFQEAARLLRTIQSTGSRIPNPQ